MKTVSGFEVKQGTSLLLHPATINGGVNVLNYSFSFMLHSGGSAHSQVGAGASRGMAFLPALLLNA